MWIIILALVVCVIILYNTISNIKKDNENIYFSLKKQVEEIERLKYEIEEVKELLQKPESFIGIHPVAIEEIIPQEIIPQEIEPISNPVEEFTNEIISPSITLVETENDIEIPINEEEPILVLENQITARIEKEAPVEEIIYEESAFSKFIKNAEKQFADNWTGILGTAIMVLGIGYLSIYTALKVSPLFRILILWLYAGLLVGAYYFLNKKEQWAKTGLWLRSAGASLFLFGCFGASQIPALTFITNSIAGYSLIALGIGINLYVGYIIKKQTFLSLHVILSILILCVIPEKLLITFILASITCTIGIILSYKEKWEYHLLTVISAFIIFDIWFNAQGTTLSATENIIAILGIIAVAASCMFMQYRSVYENSYFDKAAFITHLTNWVLFSTGLILHATGSKFKTIVLFIGAVICVFISLRARKKKIYWLYHLDGMAAFILFSLSIIMLNDLKVGYDIIFSILYLLILVCLFVVYKEKEILLHRIFLGINHVFGLFLILFGLALLLDTLDPAAITNGFATTIILFLIAISVPIISAVKKDFLEVDTFYFDKKLSLNGILAIAFSILIILKANSTLANNSVYYVIISIALFWNFLKIKFQKPTFDIGRFVLYVLTIAIGLYVLSTQQKSYTDWTFALGILIVVVYNWREKHFYNNDLIIRAIGIIGVNIALYVLVDKYLSAFKIIEILSLFGIALLNHEFLWINFKKQMLSSKNQLLLYFFYFAFAIAGSIFLLRNVSLLSNVEIGLTCLVISLIEIYVLFAKKIRNNSLSVPEKWNDFNLFNSELLFFTIVLFGFSCIQTEYVAIYFMTFAIATYIGYQKFREFNRYAVYSFLFIIGSILLTIITARDNLGNENYTLYVAQAITVSLALGYSYLQSKSNKPEEMIIKVISPYILNLWIVILLFIQIEINYLPILFMSIAIVNFYLSQNEKLQIKTHLVVLIGTVASCISIFYSIYKLNGFVAKDWIFQLSSVALGLYFVLILSKKEKDEAIKTYYQFALNIWLSIMMFSQLEHKWLPVYWACIAIANLYLYHKKVSQEKNISIVYYLLANLHLAFLSFNFYQSKFLAVYLLIFALLGAYIYLASKWLEKFKLKNSLLIYPATLSIGCFLYLTFDKGILTFFWILEALGLLILGIALKEKYFRYVSLSLVGICVVRLMFFDLSNSDFLVRALVLVGVGVVLLVMNSLFKKYKDRFD